MFRRRPLLKREDLLLTLWATVLGLAAAVAFAAYRAVNASDDASKLAEFVANLAWPGVLIFVGIAAVVWAGWKANID
ncbi:MAG: hypothetical protein WBD55_01040 [Dehalococcoidia bacterium]